MKTEKKDFQFGFITIIGKPNVGKSTLMNRLIGQKISITSHRPQTTRHRILGIATQDNYQMVFVDTPGLHIIKKKSHKKVMNKVINKTAINSIEGVDIIIFMISAKGWDEQDKNVLQALKQVQKPVILLINKIDHLKDKKTLLPLIQESQSKFDFAQIVPICALKDTGYDNINVLQESLLSYLPQGDAGFEEDQITDKSFRFLVSELIREQLFRRLGDELPYATAVEISLYDTKEDTVKISADIWVEKKSHKSMVIGKNGESLKTIGTYARKNCEALLEKKVFLELWVKVRNGWSDSVRDLHQLGYDET